MSALFFLKTASKFMSWPELKAEDPRERERSEIQYLKNKIAQLEQELEIVASKLNAIHEILYPDNKNS